MAVKTPTGQRNLRLTNVAYAPGFLTSLMGLGRCRSMDIHFDSGQDILYKKGGNELARLQYYKGHWLVDIDPSRRPSLHSLQSELSTFGTQVRPSRVPKPPSLLDRKLAHQVWAHPGRQALEKLESATRGVQLQGEGHCFCDSCKQSKLTRIISRRPQDAPATKPFERIGIDIIYIVPMNSQHFGTLRYALHAVDSKTKWHEVEATTNKSQSTLMRWLKGLIARIQRIYKGVPIYIRMDGERGFGDDFLELVNTLGLIYEKAPKHTKEPAGLPERAGGVLTIRARAMRIHANLPKHLAGELYQTAAYILNRTPTEALGWKTPYEAVYGRSPLVSHMQPIGCRAYALNTELKNADKLESRALIGHLIGYVGTNIFRIWLPATDEILVTRDVVFEPTQFFDGYEGYVTKEDLQEIVTTISLPTHLDEDYTIEELQLVQQQHQLHVDSATNPLVSPNATQLGGVQSLQTPLQFAQQDSFSTANDQLLTPSPSALANDDNEAHIVPLPDDVTPQQSDDEEFITPTNQGNILYPNIQQLVEQDVTNDDDPSSQLLHESSLRLVQGSSSNQSGRGGTGRPRGSRGLAGPMSLPAQSRDEAPPEGYQRYGETAPQNISSSIDKSAIVQGRRTRRPPGAFFTIASFAANLSEESRAHYFSAFTAQVLKQQPDGSTRYHINQVPASPRNVKELQNHMFKNEFKADMSVEWRNIRLKGCFQCTNKTQETADSEVLPLMWVFTYKTDEDGYITRFKARLVVRGDLQSPLDDTYAATLAVRNFRALISIANYFDLELYQYDVPVAFLNARMNRKLYAYTPEGVDEIESGLGELLLVLRALYGLKESPLLWFNECRTQLIKLGLKPVEGFPCLYTNRWLILFVFVDDIVMAFHDSNTSLHQRFEQRLTDVYNLKKMGELAWFLGIRVVRDRPNRRTWLIQDAYIEKVCSRFDITVSGRYPDIPITENWLDPSNEEPSKERTKLYQQLVGSLAYIAVWGRPDVARTHVILASHLINPGQKHVSKAKKVWQYLLGTKTYALQASVNQSEPEMREYHTDEPTTHLPLFYGASDASYADEPETRRSSQGYAFFFGGLMIDWKSTVQRTVTKSTTESELLSLSLAGSQMIEWMRFFKGISLQLDSKPTILCDNQQTVGIVTKREDRLHTKVKHVDIHQLWVRQEVSAGRLNVKWIATKDMPADGLTKALPRQKFDTFVKQCGLVDIKKELKDLKQHSNTKDPHVLFPH